MVDIRTIQSGYSRTKKPDMLTFRTMTLDEAKKLSYGEQVWCIDNSGKARQVKVNGAPKIWKRQPERVEIPFKYGLYEYGRFDESDIARGTLLVYVWPEAKADEKGGD